VSADPILRDLILSLDPIARDDLRRVLTGTKPTETRSLFRCSATATDMATTGPTSSTT
jgi:hypothetical protein